MWSHCGRDYHYAVETVPFGGELCGRGTGDREAVEQALVKQGGLTDPGELIKTHTASIGRKHLLMIKLHPIYVRDDLDF